MKKKLVVLLMASSMALAACNSEPAATPTAPVETTVEATDATEAGDADEASEESVDESAETSEGADATEAAATGGDVEVAENSALAMMVQAYGDLITVSAEGDKYLLTYDASLFEGLSPEEIEASLAASLQGNEEAEDLISVKEDGSVVMQMNEEQFTAMNTPMDQLIAQ